MKVLSLVLPLALAVTVSQAVAHTESATTKPIVTANIGGTGNQNRLDCSEADQKQGIECQLHDSEAMLVASITGSGDD